MQELINILNQQKKELLSQKELIEFLLSDIDNQLESIRMEVA